MSENKAVLPVACQGCALESPQLENCRIRLYQFKLFGKKCPREKQKETRGEGHE